MSVQGIAMLSVTTKLKTLKKTFRRMRKDVRDLAQNVSSAAKFLEEAQQLLYDFPHSEMIHLLEYMCRKVHNKALQQEIEMIRQRAKLSWLKEGDSCTKLFFQKVKAKHVRNRIYQIETREGVRLHGQ
ncbi:hypothetical protein Salat_2875300 [Sesamum alatum]|uniref:Uncharacterized protein n=1 Tax=Sesamum alatum TaxID=300844 RepID=A0AAE1XML0_9LAMI|nr:hypothetical protein Salat_2875300 [Sesamum alatum]